MNNDEMGGGFGSGLAPVPVIHKERNMNNMILLAESIIELKERVEKLEKIIEGNTKSNFEEMFSEDNE